MEIFLLWCVFVIVGYLLGKIKDNGAFGAVISAVLGPLGWLLVLLIADTRRKCPLCKGILPDGKLARCKNCGGDLVGLVLTPYEALALQNQKTAENKRQEKALKYQEEMRAAEMRRRAAIDPVDQWEQEQEQQ